jgi:predicted dehydrogenase
MVGFVLHWTPLFVAVQKLVGEGAIGRVFMAEGRYWVPAFLSAGWPGWEWWTHKDKAGSSLLAGGCHAVDALRSLVGPVSEVMAYSTKVTAEFDYDPTIVAALRFASGAVGKLTATLESVLPFDFQVTLLGTKGTIRDNELFSLNPPGQPSLTTISPVPFSEMPAPPFKEEIDDFVRCVVEDRDPPLSMDDAVRSHEIIFAIDRSAAEGHPVKLPLP